MSGDASATCLHKAACTGVISWVHASSHACAITTHRHGWQSPLLLLTARACGLRTCARRAAWSYVDAAVAYVFGLDQNKYQWAIDRHHCQVARVGLLCIAVTIITACSANLGAPAQATQTRNPTDPC
jgi:hypothetical protein